jgi:hypothetical protein
MQASVAQRVTNMSKAEIAKLRPRDVVAIFNSAIKAEASARDISLEEVDVDERETVPTFQINFLPAKPEGFVAVRLPSGEAGYIPRDQVARFRADYPDAVVID